MAGDGEDLPAVEIVSDPADAAVDEPARAWGGHEVVRTVAVVVTAAAVVWGAAALHGSRKADERMACMGELQMSTFFLSEFGRADSPDSRRELLDSVVEDCDFTVIPQFLENADDG